MPNTNGNARDRGLCRKSPRRRMDLGRQRQLRRGILGGVTDASSQTVAANSNFASFTVNIPASTSGPTATLGFRRPMCRVAARTPRRSPSSTPTRPRLLNHRASARVISASAGLAAPLTVLTATASSSSDGSPLTATYVLQAPGSTNWSAADNGGYTIALNSARRCHRHFWQRRDGQLLICHLQRQHRRARALGDPHPSRLHHDRRRDHRQYRGHLQRLDLHHQSKHDCAE